MARHPYRRLRAAQPSLPEVGISEEGNIRSLHLGSSTIQSAMNLERPDELVLSYSRAMMAWLLFADAPAHITQIGLGGGSFARWIDARLPHTRQTAVDINPQVIAVARSLFKLPSEEDGRFEIIEADGAQYIKTVCGGTDIILTDGFDGEQIIESLVGEEFFLDCRRALSENGIFAANWWGGDRRYPKFIETLLSAFEGRVLEVPAESHGNVAVFAFQKAPREQRFEALKKRADELGGQYGLDFRRMLSDIKAANPNNGKTLYLS
ncbi:MAG: polyamine aminopropyltransferase [Neisseria sp.]|nr:polyamine aminopropyltransferase [Neisseria sp.]